MRAIPAILHGVFCTRLVCVTLLCIGLTAFTVHFLAIGHLVTALIMGLITLVWWSILAEAYRQEHGQDPATGREQA